MIITVTLNPAIDRTVTVESFSIDKVNRVKGIQRDAGGKGINVSKTIKALGGTSKAIAVLGGRNGEWILEESKRLGLDLITVPVEGETRENIKIVDPVKRKYTDLNEGGPLADEEMVKQLLIHIQNAVGEKDYLVLSGSALPGMPEDIFKRIIESVKGKGVKVIVDVDGDYLKYAIEAKPSLIKPNIDELEAYLGKSLETEEQMVQAAKALIEKGIENVVISRGKEGLIWVDEKQVITADALTVNVKSTVGAGDAVVAALVTGLSQEKSKGDIVKLAIATATSVVMTEGSKTGTLANLEAFEKQVKVNVFLK